MSDNIELIDQLVKVNINLNTEAGGASASGDNNIYVDNILNSKSNKILLSNGDCIIANNILTGVIILTGANANLRTSKKEKLLIGIN